MSFFPFRMPFSASTAPNNDQRVPAIPESAKLSTHSPGQKEPEEEDEDDDDDLDAPAAFPALDSAQRSQAPPPPPISPPSFDISPPSPTSTSSSRTASPPPRHLSKTNAVSDPTSLPPPTTTTVKPNPALKNRQKVALQPGCSALDWARLKGGPKGSSGELRGEEGRRGFPLRVTLEELKKHNKKDDAWSAFNGRVYNITPYIPFHPGGEKELMRCAGRDGTKLFMATHAWVNVEFMMDVCLVGMLVSDDSSMRRLF